MKHLLTILTAVLLATTMQAQNLFNAATTTMESWCMPGWQGAAQTNVATWNNGTLVVTVPDNCTEIWQCQVKLHTQGIVLNSAKVYQLSCNMHSTKAVNNVTVKLFDDNGISEKNSHVLNVQMI